MNNPSSHSILQTTDLSIGYLASPVNTVIASDINLDINIGELVGIVGINGAGKSTLLRTLSGLQPTVSGEVTLSRKQIKTISPSLLAQQLSVVLTNQPISKNLSVAELVALGRQPYTNWLGTISDTDREVIIEALKNTETFTLKDKKCYELSDGQLQRVLIARALAQNTDVILLDEPMTHLDLHHKASLLKLLTSIAHTHGKTILFSTHDIPYALNACDKMIVMKSGTTHFDTPSSLISNGVFDTLFPADNVGFDREKRIFFLK